MSEWYNVVSGKGTLPNDVLFCKIEDCRHPKFTKANRRRHARTYHPNLFNKIYGGQNYNSSINNIIKEDHPKIIKEDHEENSYLDLPPVKFKNIEKNNDNIEKNNDNTKEINIKENKEIYYYPTDTNQISFSKFFDNNNNKKEEEREKRKEIEELKNYQNKYELEKKNNIINKQRDFIENKNRKIQQLENSKQDLLKMVSNLSKGKGDYENAIRNMENLQNKYMVLENELNDKAIELEQIRNKESNIEKNYKKTSNKEKQRILKFSSNNPELIKYIEACSSSCEECYKTIKNDKHRITKINNELNARILSLEKRMDTQDKKNYRFEEEHKISKEERKENKRIIDMLGKKIYELEEKLNSYIKLNPEVIKNITESNKDNDDYNENEKSIGGDISYSQFMDNLCEKMKLTTNKKINKTNTNKIIKKTKQQFKQNKEIIYEYLKLLPKIKNSKVEKTIKRIELGKIIMNELKNF